MHSDLLVSEKYTVIPHMFIKKVKVSKSIGGKSLFMVRFHAEVGDVCKDKRNAESFIMLAVNTMCRM